jgi:hypothetical protein
VVVCGTPSASTRPLRSSGAAPRAARTCVAGSAPASRASRRRAGGRHDHLPALLGAGLGEHGHAHRPAGDGAVPEQPERHRGHGHQQERRPRRRGQPPGREERGRAAAQAGRGPPQAGAADNALDPAGREPGGGTEDQHREQHEQPVDARRAGAVGDHERAAPDQLVGRRRREADHGQLPRQPAEVHRAAPRPAVRQRPPRRHQGRQPEQRGGDGDEPEPVQGGGERDLARHGRLRAQPGDPADRGGPAGGAADGEGQQRLAGEARRQRRPAHPVGVQDRQLAPAAAGSGAGGQYDQREREDLSGEADRAHRRRQPGADGGGGAQRRGVDIEGGALQGAADVAGGVRDHGAEPVDPGGEPLRLGDGEAGDPLGVERDRPGRLAGEAEPVGGGGDGRGRGQRRVAVGDRPQRPGQGRVAGVEVRMDAVDPDGGGAAVGDERHPVPGPGPEPAGRGAVEPDPVPGAGPGAATGAANGGRLGAVEGREHQRRVAARAGGGEHDAPQRQLDAAEPARWWVVQPGRGALGRGPDHPGQLVDGAAGRRPRHGPPELAVGAQRQQRLAAGLPRRRAQRDVLGGGLPHPRGGHEPDQHQPGGGGAEEQAAEVQQPERRPRRRRRRRDPPGPLRPRHAAPPRRRRGRGGAGSARP